MPPPPEFNMLKACFVLMAVIVLVMVSESALTVLACGWLVLTGREKAGACIEAGVVGQAREILELALTTVLALLLAGRKPPEQ